MADDIQQQPPEETQQQPGAQVYDISGPKPVLGEMPHEQVQDAIASGRFSLPKGDVSVFSPEGEYGTLPADQAKDAFNAGYRYATPDQVKAKQDEIKYSSPIERSRAGFEAAGRGFLGPVATGLERAAGVSPESIKAREEQNPELAHSVEAAAFGASMLLGTGEAQVLLKSGQGVAKAAEAIGLSGKVAQGAIKMATEMSLMQGGDEVSKYLMNAPDSVGNALTNVGLSALLGGATGVGFAGLGKLGAKLAENKGFKEFTDRIKYRMTGADPLEAAREEADKAYKTYKTLGSEIGGAGGLKDTAVDNLVPEMHEGIQNQVRELSGKLAEAAQKLDSKELRSLQTRLQSALTGGSDVVTGASREAANPAELFKTMDTVKRQLGEYGKFNKDFVPLAEQPMRNFAKAMGAEFKEALEDSKVWGKAGQFQKTLNEAWSDAIPGVRDFEKKFMQKQADGSHILDPQKFVTYTNQNGKATTSTVRQHMMGSFVDAVEKFQEASAKAYEAAGLEYPHPTIGTSALRETLSKPSVWAKAADLWYEKAMSTAAGEGLGGAAGATLANMTGLPGAGMAGFWLGSKVGGHLLPSIIQPLMEKVGSARAYQEAVKLSEAAIKGQKHVQNSAMSVFKGVAYPHMLKRMPDSKKLDKLDAQITELSQDPSKLVNVAGNVGHYMPNHAQELGALSQRAVSYLAGLKPHKTTGADLDTLPEPTKAEMAPYYRALTIAENPLSVMDRIQNGTILPSDVTTIQNVSPALYGQMSQALMTEIANRKNAGENIPYNLRMSLSMFLGRPLDSTMTPSSIQAAQPQPKPIPAAQGGAQGKTRKGTSTLGKSNKSYQTGAQAAEADRQGRD